MCCSYPWCFCQNQPNYYVSLCPWSGLPVGAAERRIFLCDISEISTTPKSIQLNVPIMFFSIRIIIQIAWLYFLDISRVFLFGVGWQGGLSSRFLPDSAITVYIFPVDYFRRLSSFVYLFGDLHYFEHILGPLVSVTFKISPFKIVLLGPSIGGGVEQNLVDIHFIHILAIIQFR